MYYPALQYQPRIKMVKGRITHQPATYRRLRVLFSSQTEAADAAVELHSRHKDRYITKPVVMSEDLRWFDFVPTSATTFGPSRVVSEVA